MLGDFLAEEVDGAIQLFEAVYAVFDADPVLAGCFRCAIRGGALVAGAPGAKRPGVGGDGVTFCGA